MRSAEALPYSEFRIPNSAWSLNRYHFAKLLVFMLGTVAFDAGVVEPRADSFPLPIVAIPGHLVTASRRRSYRWERSDKLAAGVVNLNVNRPGTEDVCDKPGGFGTRSEGIRIIADGV